MNDLHALAERYVSVWNEPDAAARRRLIAALWADDGEHFTPSLHVRGHRALEGRVIGAWEKWVRDANHRFRYCGNADGHHGGVRFHWEMIAPSGESVLVWLARFDALAACLSFAATHASPRALEHAAHAAALALITPPRVLRLAPTAGACF